MLTGTKDLRAALGAVGSAVSSRPGIPALTGVRIKAEPGRLELTATDLEVSAVLEVSAEVELEAEQWSALVPWKLLKEAARAFKGERFSIRPNGAGSVAINGAGSLRCLPLEDFPTLSRPADLFGSFDAGRFRSLVESVEPACSSDAARPVLTGALLEGEADGYLSMAATDSYCLHVGRISGAVGAGKVIVPGRALRTVSKLIGKRGDGTVLVLIDGAKRDRNGYIESTSVGFEVRLTGSSSATVLVVRAIEGEFPNYRQLIPEPWRPGDAGGELHYQPAELLEAIGNAAPYCRDTSPARFELGPVGVRISASSPDLGEYAADVAGTDWSGDAISAAFNPTYLGGCVVALEGAAGPIMAVRDGLKPALFRAPGDGLERVALVMPVRMPDPVAVPKVEPAPEPARCGICGHGAHGGQFGCRDCAGACRPAETSRQSVDVAEDETDPGPADTAEPEDETEYAPAPEQDLPPLRDRVPVAAAVGAPLGDSDRFAPAVPVESVEVAPAAMAAAYGVSTAPEPAPVVEQGPNDDGAGGWADLATIGEVATGRGALVVRLKGAPDGTPWVDVRRYVRSNRYDGPTRKGWAIPAAIVADVVALLEDARAAAETV